MRFLCFVAALLASASAAERPKRYYAHEVVEDRFGVIAPWYKGQNGQCDFRVRIAAETLKRYPWVGKDKSVAAGPHFVFNGHWRIARDGTITVPMNVRDWANGDLGQRAAYVLSGLVEYYRYSGDPAAISHTNHARQLADFVRAIASNGQPLVDGREGRRAVALIQAIYQSATSGRTVEVGEW